MLTQLFRTTRSGWQVLVGSRMLESGTSGSEKGQWSIGHGYNLSSRMWKLVDTNKLRP